MRDVLIIGGGPAGLTAGIYLCRARITATLLERQIVGGQAMLSPLIENYPGFPEGIEGAELMEKMKKQAENFGLEILPFSDVDRLLLDADRKIAVSGGKSFEARSVIITAGRSPKKLGIPGEDKFTGRGVSYCATCDAPLFRDRRILVVGGGDAAIEESLHLASFASRVTVVHRRSELRASDYLQERAKANPRIDFLFNSELTELRGDDVLTSAVVLNNITGEKQEVPVSGVFLYVGNVPNTGFLPPEIELDENGYIKTDSNLETTVPGVFAAGDVRSGSRKQVICAAAEGAMAAMNAQRYLESTGARKPYEGGNN